MEAVCNKNVWKMCDKHKFTLRKRGRYFIVKCTECNHQWVCSHAPNDRILVCPSCLETLLKEGDVNESERS